LQVTAEDIQLVARLVSDLCGIVLDESKDYLIQHRLSDVAESTGCKSFSDLYHKVRAGTDKSLEMRIINAITTRETLFFRDDSPYQALQHKVLPELIDAREATPFPRRLRIWSAACSTGQEPYSIAMVLRELIPNIEQWDITITATDISDAAIEQASQGMYRAAEIQRGMRMELLQKYFIEQTGAWKTKDELRGMVAFRRINLLEKFPLYGPYDIIFCRNVAIYFKKADRQDLFKRLAKMLSPDGYLFVGSLESLTDLGVQFRPHHHCRAVFYRPNLEPAMLGV
jgi:chemotaxis protein methyltransferase CheR